MNTLKSKICLKQQSCNYPQTSKIRSQNLKKKLFSKNDFLYSVIISHLYIERLLNEILIKEVPHDIDKGSNSFYKKISIIQKLRHLDYDLCEDIILINNIRNKYAHELNYDIRNFDIYKFIIINIEKIQTKVHHPKNRRILNELLFKLAIIEIQYQMCKNKDYLFLIDEK